MNYSLRYAKILSETITARKLKNYLSLRESYHRSIWFQKVIHRGNPASLGIEPTTACNLRCPHCVSGNRSFTRPTGRMSWELYHEIINQTYQDLLFLVLYFQGEPYLNPQFLEMVNYAHSKNIFTMTSSNGHFLDSDKSLWTVESGLHSLIISIDGITQETYQKYRKEGELDKVKEGIQNLVDWKKKKNSITPLINLQFIVFKHNEHEINEMKSWGKKVGVDFVSIKTAQIYNPEENLDLIPTDEKLSRYKIDPLKGLQIQNSLDNRCWRLWQGAEITQDGRVLPCCFDKDALHQMGLFNPNDPISFQKIWKESESYAQFRNQIIKGRKEIEMCRNCTEGTKIWV